MPSPIAPIDNFLNPDTAQFLQSLIVSNTATTITVWADFEDLGAVRKTYQVNDYRLDSAAGSPCIDAADNNAVTICSADLDGNERIIDDPATPGTGEPSPGGDPDSIIDMGAYEFGSPLSADCNTNETPDECDIASGSSLDCDGLGVPDECCQADMSGDGSVGSLDLAILLASWGACNDCTPGVPACTCQPDLNNDCAVGPIDLATLLGAWGSCQ